MLTLYMAIHNTLPSWLPGWLQTPLWFRHLDRPLFRLVVDHQALGLFGVIFAEELGIPMPAPGDVVIALGGYFTTTGRIPLLEAYLGVILGAMMGSSVLYALSRRFGHPFLVRFGPYVGFGNARLMRTEAAFARWGPWAIIVGRHIPGLRIVLSAFAGAFEVRYRVFLPSVAVSATIWAAIFISLGRYLGPRTRLLFRLFPAHLVPWLLLVLGIFAIAFIAYEHGYRPRRERRREAAGSPETPIDEAQEPATR